MNQTRFVLDVSRRVMMKVDKLIFLVENSADYVFLLEQAFQKAGISYPLKIARYGNEAILYLKGVGIYGDRSHYPLPQIIILDMSIADGSALSVLGWIRKQPAFSAIPVFVLVLASDKRMVYDALDKGANAYFIKRDDLDELVRMIKGFDVREDANKSPQSQECS